MEGCSMKKRRVSKAGFTHVYENTWVKDWGRDHQSTYATESPRGYLYVYYTA